MMGHNQIKRVKEEFAFKRSNALNVEKLERDM
jgi:hypothetical protein